MQRTDYNDCKVNIWNALLASIFILASFVVVLFVCGITPFGDKTFLMYDLKRQYADYYAYYRTVISGKNNIFYSFSTALGSGTLGFFAYYLTSPFLLILSFFDKTDIPLGVTVIIGLKLMLSAFIMDIFIQKRITKKAGISTLLGAVAFSFSGFLFAQSMNMMWMDVVILLPLYIDCLETLLETGKKTVFIIVLALMLVLNYYISYQVLIFTGLWTLLHIYVNNCEKPFKLILRVIHACFIAGLLTMALLFPTALELMDSPKDVAQLGLSFSGQNLGFIDLISKLPTHAYDQIEPRFGYPQLFCGVLMVFLLLMYFISEEIPKRERIGMFSMLFIFMLSFGIEAINLFWHALMQPSGHPYRQAFMFVFVVVICAVRAFDCLEKELSIKKLLAVMILMAAGLFLIKRGNYDHISRETLVLNAVIILVYSGLFAALFLVREKSRAAAVIIMSVLLLCNCIDLVSNAAFTYEFEAMKCEMASGYKRGIALKDEAVSLVKDYDGSFYRMEDLHPRQQNDGLQYDYMGVTHYSSAGKIYVRYLLQRLGFNDDTLYTGYGHDNTMTMDSILGIKYVLSNGEHKVHPDYQLLFEGDESSYANPYALSVAMGVNDFDLEGIYDPIDNITDTGLSHVPDIDVFSLQEDIFSRIAGEEVSVFDAAFVKENEMYEEDGKYIYDFEVEPASDGELFFYLQGLVGAEKSLSVYLQGEFVSTYGNASCVKVLNLGYHKKGERVLLSVWSEDEDSDIGKAYFVTENAKKLAEAYEKAEAKKLSVTKKSSSHIKIAAGNYAGAFLTIPYESGWQIWVDGKKTKAIAVYDALMYIPMHSDRDEHVIDMYYVPKGIFVGVILSLFGLMLFVLSFAGDRKKIAIMGCGAFLGLTIVTIAYAVCGGKNLLDDSRFMYAKVKEQSIRIYNSREKDYLFLPSYADESDVKLSSYAKENAKDLEVVKSANLPTVFINTVSGSLDNVIADKDYREKGSITVVDEEGKELFSSDLKYIKGRGNYSFSNWSKKSFKIKLKRQGEFLGLGRGEDFVFIANASDATLIRNDVARKLEVAVGIPYATTGTFTDLYVNGEYYGNYYLCSSIEVGEDRINITDLDEKQDKLISSIRENTLKVYETPSMKGWNLPDINEDITGGYLLEREFVDRYNLEYGEINNGFVTDHDEHFIVVSPEYCSAKEINYIYDYFNAAEKEIYTGVGLGTYIDVESFAKRYMVEELVKNYDGGVSSAYYYKDSDLVDGLIYAGPGWDFDMSLGNYLDWMEYYGEDPTGITKLFLSWHSSTYYKNLTNYQEFNDLVTENFQDKALPFMKKEAREEIDELQRKLSASANMDHIRWMNMYEEKGYYAGEAEEYQKLKDFIEVRCDFLSGEWTK